MFNLNKITDIVKNVPDIAKNLPLDKIFTNDFMANNTNFKNITEFINKSGIDISSLIGVSDSKDKKLNDFVSSNSKFGDWKEMYSSAVSLFNKK